MRKLLSIIIATVMIIGVLPVFGINFTKNEAKAANNTPAIFIVKKWAPVGSVWQGNQLVDDRTKAFDGVGTAWGSNQYPMPGPGAFMRGGPEVGNARLVFNANPLDVQNPLINADVPAGTQAAQLISKPLFWTEFYITAVPDKGNSQLYEKWTAVVDDMGQLWFDPDPNGARFNDSRYYAAADPETEVYKSITGGTGADNCQNNAQMKVDPSSNNNTQGPYIYMPTDVNGNWTAPTLSSPVSYPMSNVPEDYPLFSRGIAGGRFSNNTGLFFKEPRNGRVFQIGYLDMPDFPLVRADVAIPISGASTPRPSLEQIGTSISQTQVGQVDVIVDTTVLPFTTRPIYDWDQGGDVTGNRVGVGGGFTGVPLTRFLDGFNPAAIPGYPPNPAAVAAANFDLPPDINVGAYFYNDPAIINLFDYGEEWHSSNVSLNPPPTLGFTIPGNAAPWMDIYDPGEYIYRAGFNAPQAAMSGNRTVVFGYDGTNALQTNLYQWYGCVRLTPVNMFVQGLFYNYAPGTVVRELNLGGYQWGRWDSGEDMDLNDPRTGANRHNLYRFPLTFNNFAAPGGAQAPLSGAAYQVLHANNVNWNPNYRFNYNRATGLGTATAPSSVYDPYESIYMKSTGTLQNGFAVVEAGDWRLTNVNGNTWSLDAWMGGLNPANPGVTAGNISPLTLKVGGMWFGDALILSEIVTGGCAAPSYNLSVQTDLWMGVIPSETAASLRSPNDDFDEVAQMVQKNAAVGNTGTVIDYPTTVFQDMKFGYREYVGVEVWRDDNRDCNWGFQYGGPIPPGENLFMLNLSDDYRQGKTGEAHIGMRDGYAAKDVGRPLLNFWDNNGLQPQQSGFANTVNPLPPNGPLNPTQIAPRFYDTANAGGFGTTNLYGVGEAIYMDNNADYQISAGDLRMTDVVVQRGSVPNYSETIKYNRGSIVLAGDADVDLRPGGNNDLSDFVPVIGVGGQVIFWPAFFDERVEDVLNPGFYIDPNNRFDIGEVIYNCAYTGTTTVMPGFQRLNDIILSNTLYPAGSIVPEPDFWLYQMPIYGISMGQNCDYNYVDMMAVPGKTGMKINIDKPLKVEQTSQIDISFDPPPSKEYYDEFGNYHPEEIIYVYIRNNGLLGTTNLNEIYRVVSGRQPTAKFQFTPYRGTCANNGNSEKLNYLVDASELQVRIRSYRDLGGTNNPAPLDRNYHDMWMLQRDADNPNINIRLDARWGRPYKLAKDGIKVRRPELTPPMPFSLINGYDCYQEAKFNIAPEQLAIEPSVACLQTLDQRFPNFSVTLRDADNPEDVNDPNGMRLSIPLTDTLNVDPVLGREQYLIATYNGHGGGIDWIGTAVDDGPQHNKYIIQVNTDGSYLFWFWYEPDQFAAGLNDRARPQIQAALDSNDLLLGQDITGITINWRPGGGPYLPPQNRVCRTPVIVKEKATWYDTDCSASTVDFRKFSNCQPFTLEGMKEVGEVSGMSAMWTASRSFTLYETPGTINVARRASDYYGEFRGTAPFRSWGTRSAWIAGINPAYQPTSLLWTGPWSTGFGVQTVVTSYGQRDVSDPGGDALIAMLPRDGSTHLQLQVYTVNAMYDYNSSIPHPSTGAPYFVLDNLNKADSEGIDYYGVADLKVYQPDPYVNFAEWNIVDHALQYSRVNYTSGADAVSPLQIPTPQVQYPYNPILRTSKGEFRCYPGGQTHTGRVIGGNFGNNGGAFGWNAYPAIWKEKFYKLGTEFFPLTDYGIFFILKDGEGNHLSFNPCWPVDQRIKRMVIEGPFARPREWDNTTHTVLPKYKAWGLENVPIQYDWSGKIVIDATNYNQYEYAGVDTSGAGLPLDFTRRSGLVGNVTLPPANDLLNFNGRLDYTSVGACSSPGSQDNLFVIDELIPWNFGKILIYVTLWDGTFKMYQDCCVAPPVDGIDVNALDLSLSIAEDTERKVAFLDKSQTFNVTINEKKIGEKKNEQEWYDADGALITPCNDAVAYVWQDRGTKRRGSANLLFGAGDGWTSGVPTSSRRTNQAPQYDEFQDIDRDGFISFDKWETEILGSYNMATNTWATGIIDGRTFQRNDGMYTFKLGESATVTMVGLDFGGEVITDRQDHVIATNEVLPLYITAYKYGDDNNDRAFSPFWDFDSQAQSTPALRRYSHEVYLAGQKAVPIEPDLNLTINVMPEKLTAGVTPELVDVQKPLTFQITKGSEPVDLVNDAVIDDFGNKKADEEVVWNNLILDPHPDNVGFFGLGSSLPQYYWVRTDLHNDDKTAICNTQLYGIRNTANTPPIVAFNPIVIDFSQSAQGRYVFRGFCANDNNQYMENIDKDTMDPKMASEDYWMDNHKFYVKVYTPDRKFAGEVYIPVFSPNVEYKITNTEDPNKVAYDSPGDPEFIMTAADNRIYKIQVTCRDALGVLIKGVTKGVSVCGGGVKNTARFTPFSTRPKSYDFALEECMRPPCCTQVELHVAFDFTPDERIRKDDHELYLLSGFNMNRSASTSSCSGSSSSVMMGFARYNTTNKWYWGGANPNTWDVTREDGDEVMPWIAWDLPPPVEGWGLGAIYNHSWYGGFLFADIDQNGVLNYHDSLGLDVNAQTEFYVFAEDIAYIGGLVGDNVYCNTPANADLAGFPPVNDKSDPRYTEKRFRQAYTNDTVFYLDWDAPPDHVATIDSPRIQMLYADTREEVNRGFLNANNYDLIYGVQNHLIAVVRPADQRDVAMKEDSRVYMSGNQHEKTVYGHTKRSTEDAKAVETTIEFLPTGINEATAEITFMSPNKWYLKDPYQFVVPEWYAVRGGGIARNRPAEEWNPWLFDVGYGLTLVLEPVGDLFPQVEGKVMATVRVAGSNAPVAGAKVKLTGAGVDVEMTTDAKGMAEFKVKPTEMGIIKGNATAPDFLRSATQMVKVSKDNNAPSLMVDPPASPTKNKTITITGTTEPGATVTINGKKVTVGADGKFKADVELTKEGENVISIVTKDAAGNQTSTTVTVVLDTTPPNISHEPFKPVTMAKTYEIVGRVDPGSKVTVNGKDATVVNDYFRVVVDLKDAPSTTPVQIVATDKAGNVNTLPVEEIINMGLRIVKMQINNPVMTVNGEEKSVNPPPQIVAGSTMVPLRALADAFGATTDYKAETKTVTITLGTTVIEIQINSPVAIVNGQQKEVKPPAMVTKEGRTLVPFRFIAEALGAKVDYDAATKTITITKTEMP